MYDGSFLYGPIAVFPNVCLSWRVAKPKDITPESLKLFFMLQPKLDVLVLGVGSPKNMDLVRKSVIESIRNQKIGLELLPTVSILKIIWELFEF
jgi:NADH dehydrogenase [ubiquinone] 1 alpha subcomplex assembly factor 3